MIENDPRCIPLFSLHFDQPLVMMETTAYFEAYRPVLKALQMAPNDENFPLSDFILKLSNAPTKPDYTDANTQYDFTPLLVDPMSSVNSVLKYLNIGPINQQRTRQQYNRNVRRIHLEMDYSKKHTVPDRFRRVSIANVDEWPSTEQLNLNPRQREALIAALTRKVALIQGRK